jgi:hypothetical protein
MKTTYNVKAISFDDEDEGWDYINEYEGHWFVLNDFHYVSPHTAEMSPTPGKITFLIFEKED